MTDFPSEMPYDGGMAGKATLKLIESTECSAFYQTELGFGFKWGLEFEMLQQVSNKSKTLASVKHLSGNNWGKGTWLICRTDYYPTMQRALDALTGKIETPKGKRKPRTIQPMTQDELNEWSEA